MISIGSWSSQRCVLSLPTASSATPRQLSVHDLPTWTDLTNIVQLTRTRNGGGRCRRFNHLRVAPLPTADVIQLGGLPVTSLARTVLDVARTVSYERAVAVGDAAMARGLTRPEADAALSMAKGWPGVPSARRAISFMDGRSESVGESMSRIVLDRLGMPVPELQYEVFDSAGTLVGRSDFCFEQQRTLAEFDGRVKYGRLLREGQTAADVPFAEKLREDALRDLGWQVVRWIWADLSHPRVIAERLERAFARAHC